MFCQIYAALTLTLYNCTIGKRSVITETQLPDGNESVHQLHVMEEQIRR